MLLSLLSLALAQTVPMKFREGKNVYNWPANWYPKGVSAQGLEEIQLDIEGRHYPFYVVLIQGEALPGSGDGMERLQVATDELMAQWGGEGMDLGEYSVFSVAGGAVYKKPPSGRRAGTVCKFFLNTGSTFINGPANFLPSRDHETFTQHFLDSVSTTPQDPKGGILRVIDAVDGMLWERTDPEKIVARAEQALVGATEIRKALLERASESEAARYSYQVQVSEVALQRRNTDEMIRIAEEMSLNNESLRARVEQREMAESSLRRLIRKQKEYPLSGVAEDGEFDALQARAEDVLERQDLEDVVAITEEVQEANSDLQQRVEAKRARERRRLHAQMGGVVVGGSGFFVSLIALGARRRKVALAAMAYEDSRDRIALQLDNAASRYMSLELDDRETLAALQDTGGRTGEECRAIGTELDDIYAGIRALESHLDRIDAQVDKLSVIDFEGRHTACDALTKTFSYDTGELVNDELFAGETRVIEIDGEAFMTQLADRFTAVVTRRERLLQASEIRFKDAASQLPHEALDALLGRLQAHRVPLRWLDDHPLFGDDAADQTLYGRLDSIRLDDPLAYLEELESLRAVEAAGAARVDALEEMLSALAEAALEQAPQHQPCVLSSEDDPAHAWAKARGQQDTMRGLLAEGAVTKATEQVLDKGNEARQTWLQCRRQAAEIDSAVEGLAASKALAVKQLNDADASLGSARKDLEAGSVLYTRAHIGVARLDAGDASLASARELLAKAAGLEQSRRFLDAHRALQSASQLAGQASQEAHQARDHLSQLEEEHREYERRLAAVGAARQVAEKKLRGYGGSASVLDDFAAPELEGAQDYRSLCGHIDTVEAGWTAHVRVARRAHEAEQRRKREAAERARRQAARARRAASTSSRSSWKSSSSSSSFSSSRRRSSSSSSSRRRSSSSSSSRRRSSGGGGSSRGGGRSSGGGGGW